MQDGYIILSRKIFSHWLHENSEYFRAWIDMIAFSNYAKKTALIDGELIDCDRGQSVHSVKKWASIFGKNWSEQKVRTFFKLLEKDKMINVEGLRKTTRVTIVNYDTYNGDQRTDNEQTTNRQRTDNEQITTTELKELKELKELTNTLPEKSGHKKTLEDRKKEFHESLWPFIEEYGKETLREFFNYWTESNENGKKMRFEMQRTFDRSLRLATWKKNKSKFTFKGNANTQDVQLAKTAIFY